jgi:hypothetical protein
MNERYSLDAGSEKPNATPLSGDVDRDLRLRNIPLEKDNVGAADGDALLRLNEIHDRLSRGDAQLDDLTFLFRLNHTLLVEGMALRARIDDLKHEYIKLMYEKRKL